MKKARLLVLLSMLCMSCSSEVTTEGGSNCTDMTVGSVCEGDGVCRSGICWHWCYPSCQAVYGDDVPSTCDPCYDYHEDPH